LVLPLTWSLLALSLLVAGAAVAQPQPPARQRQDRRASLPATPAEPMLELYVAPGNLTLATFNASLDPASLVVDRTRFKWAEVSDHFLMLEPFTDVSERLIVQVGFKDRALPAKAVISVISKVDVMDGRVEVDRRANTPEALLAALAQKEAELEEFKARYTICGPAGLMLSGWLNEHTGPMTLDVIASAAESHGLKVRAALGYLGQFSVLLGVPVHNLHQKPWVLGQVRITDTTGAPVKVLTVQMKPEHVAPGEEGLVVVEVQMPPWEADKTVTVELVGVSDQRRITFNLKKR
jgi:uncharacterized protein (TIGR02268 family)